MLFKKRKNKDEVREVVKEILDNELKSILHDVTYRLETLYTKEFDKINNTISKISSRDLNLANHMLDGYVIEDNKPTAGSIQWTDCNITYKGTNYVITNGSTNKKYVWWDFSATVKTAFQVSDTKPELEEDDVLVFVNEGGIHTTIIGNGKMATGAAIKDGTLSGAELKNGAIGTVQLAGGAVTGAIIASGAVDAAKIASGAVGSTQLASGAVTSGKIGSNAVASGNIASGAVGTSQLATNAVDSTKIASGAVGSSQIAGGAVGTTQLAANAVDGTKIATGAVTGAKIASGTITGGNIGAGAIASDKLNLASHLIF